MGSLRLRVRPIKRRLQSNVRLTSPLFTTVRLMEMNRDGQSTGIWHLTGYRHSVCIVVHQWVFCVYAWMFVCLSVCLSVCMCFCVVMTQWVIGLFVSVCVYACVHVCLYVWKFLCLLTLPASCDVAQQKILMRSVQAEDVLTGMRQWGLNCCLSCTNTLYPAD